MASGWMPRIDREVCTGCGDCIAVCPTKALGWRDAKPLITPPPLCTYCADCENICPVNAVELPYLIVRGELREGGES